MKHFFVVAFVCLSMMSVNAQTKAQPGSDFKIAYFDLDSLLAIMPEFKIAADSAQSYYTKLEARMYLKNVKLEGEMEELDRMAEGKAKEAKKKEIEDMSNDISNYQVTSQENYEAYKTKLLVPVFAKISAAAKKVAKEKGYAFVLDGSKTATTIVFANESYNIFDDMCKELGIPVPRKK